MYDSVMTLELKTGKQKKREMKECVVYPCQPEMWCAPYVTNQGKTKVCTAVMHDVIMATMNMW